MGSHRILKLNALITIGLLLGEGRLDASGNIMVGLVIVNQGEVVRPSQLIASVVRTVVGARVL